MAARCVRAPFHPTACEMAAGTSRPSSHRACVPRLPCFHRTACCPGLQEYVKKIKLGKGELGLSYTSRYIGSQVLPLTLLLPL